MNRRILALAVGGWAALLMAPGPAEAQTKITMLDSNTVTYLPAYVVLDQGIFAHHGLEITRTVIPNASYTTTALFSGSGQVVTLTPIPLIQATTQGLDLVAISASDVVPSPGRWTPPPPSTCS